MFEWIFKPNANGEYMNINLETGIINYARKLEWCPYIYQGKTTVEYIENNMSKIDEWILKPYLKWCKKREVA